MIRTEKDLKNEFHTKAELREEIQRLDERLQILMEEKGMVKEYATYSPNSRGHEMYQAQGGCGEDEDWAREFADSYLSMDPKSNIHADDQAAAVYRWTTDWEYLDGYPKSRNEIAAMREARARKDKS